MKKDDIVQYAVAVIVAVIIVGGLYAVEVTTSGSGGLSALNVSLAAGTLFLMGTVLLLGPLSRMFAVFDRACKYRKELGIISFFTAAAHVYLAMFPLARNGPWGLYRSRPFSAYPGLEALIILFVLFILSNSLATRMLGTKLWWQIQYWGARTAFVLIALHVFVLKHTTISSYLLPSSGGPPGGSAHYPPLVIWEVQFVLLILVIRLSELFGAKAARIITIVMSLSIILMMAWAMFLR